MTDPAINSNAPIPGPQTSDLEPGTNIAVPTESVPAKPASKHAFDLLATVFAELRTSLEADAPRSPRWVRIAHARHAFVRAQGDQKAPIEQKLSDVIQTIVAAFVKSIAYFAKLVLDLKDLLIQAEAGKLLLVTSAELLRKITDESFTTAMAKLVNQDSADLSSIGDAITQARSALDHVPTQEMLDKLSKELYLLLRVAHTDGAFDPAATGKIRMLQWAYGCELPIYGLGAGVGSTVNSTILGASQRVVYDALTVVALTTSQALLDSERDQFLAVLGYAGADALKDFQAVNGLTESGELDLATINRLHHLDDRTGQLVRAKPYDADAVQRARLAIAEARKAEEAKKAEEEAKKADPPKPA
ncbi:peptidoglycan-binding domain-containing protein [Nannocystis sp.]|uniref:peptidoglycan-binding domain-containing protein n=1 Tax=Nannocystis sp. TaxID=1962667 RepID=UPI0025CDBECD|nr:peptidoglycan-binding domain-containing protein [Nannocystis sp.]MBK7827034.1 hypothetical protein [Nannocystis sp.]